MVFAKLFKEKLGAYIKREKKKIDLQEKGLGLENTFSMAKE